jgi:hypothetical protein
VIELCKSYEIRRRGACRATPTLEDEYCQEAGVTREFYRCQGCLQCSQEVGRRPDGYTPAELGEEGYVTKIACL